MEIFTFLLMIIILVVVINQSGKLSKHLQRLEAELKLLRRQLSNADTNRKEVTDTELKKEEVPQTAPESKTYKSLFTIDEAVTDATTSIERTTEIQEEEMKVVASESPAKTAKENETIAQGKQQQQIYQPSFFERHPDMEKFIGENLVSKIGIAILVLAIGFFVKYAIDQNWIGPVARVAIGILCGGILVALAHNFRNIYKGFSSVLAGGGIAVFYFTITLAFQQFHIFSQSAAFIIMIVITIFAVVLSLLYDKQELAIISLIGGFMAPFLVSTGDGNYKALFSYLVILNSGLLLIAYYKAWRLLNFLNFIFTVLIFSSWLFFLKNTEPAATYRNAFLFSGIYYIQFFIINIAHNIKENKKFISSDFGILLANTALYFGTGIYCLNEMNATGFRGLFSISMGVLNLVVSYLLFRKQKVDTNILYLLIGITLTFISITAPIQLHGNYITIFWASEAVLLYWLFTKSKLNIIRYSSVLIWSLMIVSLLIDWMQIYYNLHMMPLGIIINKGFITTLYAGMATYVLFLIRNRENENIKVVAAGSIPGKNMFRVFAVSILFAAGALEINHQFTYYYPESGVYILYLILYAVTFIEILVSITQSIKQLLLNKKTVTAILSAAVILYLLLLDATFSVQAIMLTEHSNAIHFTAHWLTALLIAGTIYRLIRLFIKNNDLMIKEKTGFVAWILCSVIVIYLSAEIHLIVNNLFFNAGNSLENIQRIYIKTGLPILWGLCSFAFMWLGMHYKYRMLRIISLSLFTLTLFKLFIFDIRNIPAGGKIAAFFCLGVLLLVVSFMYQRLKKIIIDDEEKMV